MRRIVGAVGLVLVGAAAGVAAERMIVARAGPAAGAARAAPEGDRAAVDPEALARAEEACRREAELRLLQVVRLSRFERFAETGADVALVLVASRAASPDRGTRVPRVLLDAGARARWTELGGSLAGFEGGVDPRVFEAFREVRGFAAEHPWPSGTDLGPIARSGWDRAEVVERWLALNRRLASRASAALGRLYEES